MRLLTRRRTRAKISSNESPPYADHFRQRRRISPIGAGLLGADRARRRIEGDRHARSGVDQREPARQRLVAARERILPRGIQNDDLHPRGQRGERLGKIGDANSLQRNVDVVREIGVDRNEKIIAVELQSEPGKIDQRHRIGSGSGNLIEKFAERFPQRGLIEIRRARDGESGGLQGVGNQSGIVGRSCKLGGLVLVVADHQREARLRMNGKQSEVQCQNGGDTDPERTCKNRHEIPQIGNCRGVSLKPPYQSMGPNHVGSREVPARPERL